MGLASMTGALSGHYAVLAAPSPEAALRLIARQGPCQVAFCETFDDAEAGENFAAELDEACPGIAILALARDPCPDPILNAVIRGAIDGICLLPLSPESLREKTLEALENAGRRQKPDSGQTDGEILTREEVDFLLGRDMMEPMASN